MKVDELLVPEKGELRTNGAVEGEELRAEQTPGAARLRAAPHTLCGLEVREQGGAQEGEQPRGDL